MFCETSPRHVAASVRVRKSAFPGGIIWNLAWRAIRPHGGAGRSRSAHYAL